MSRGLNKVELIGNLGADPDIKYTPNGTMVAHMNLATPDRRKDKDGEWQERTEWHRVVMFGRQAEIAKDYLHKGSKVYFAGRLTTRNWDDDKGKHYLTEIIAGEMIMLDAKKDVGNDRAAESTEDGGHLLF